MRESRTGFALGLLALLAALAFALLLGLRADPMDRSSETRCVEVVRRMVETRELLVPYFGDKVRLQKPPLFYWAGAAAATLFGETGPLPVRTVSVCAALGLVALVGLWGRSLGGGGAGLLAAGLLAVMVQVHTSGRRGDAEMLLALLSTAALFCFDRIADGGWRRGLWAFAVLAGLAFLTKATAIVFTIALPILVYLALERRLRALRERSVLASLALAAGIGISWYVAILVFVPGALQLFRDALLLPLGSGEARAAAHFRPVWWYLSVLPARALPASIALPLVLWRLGSTRLQRGEPRRRFAALVFLVPFAAFSLLPQKQKHYTLSMLPGLALCSADALAAAAREFGARFRWGLRVLGPLGAVACATGAVLHALFFHWLDDLSPLASAACVALPFTAFALAGAAALAARPGAAAAGLLFGFVLLAGLENGAIEPRATELAKTYATLPIDERERLVFLSRDHPDFARLFFWLQAQVANDDD